MIRYLVLGEVRREASCEAMELPDGGAAGVAPLLLEEDMVFCFFPLAEFSVLLNDVEPLEG
jgi:hypothetical protein